MEESLLLYHFPEIFLFITSAIILILYIVEEMGDKIEAVNSFNSYVKLYIIVLVVTGMFTYMLYRFEIDYTNSWIVLNKSILFLKLCLFFGSALLAFIIAGINIKQKILTIEYFFLYNSAVFGSSFILESANLFFLFVSSEAVSFCLYGLVAINKSSVSMEAALKYFIYGAVYSLMLAFAVSIYQYNGFISLTDLFFNSNIFDDNVSLFILPFLFINLFFCFKLYIAPLHEWVPDIYQGSPLGTVIVVTFLPVVSFWPLYIRFLVSCYSYTYSFIPNFEFVQLVFYNVLLWGILIGAVIGTLGAITQMNTLRFIAYSSISHVSWIVVPFLFVVNETISQKILYSFDLDFFDDDINDDVLTPSVISYIASSIHYGFIYFITTVAFLILLTIFFVKEIPLFKGLYYFRPVLALFYTFVLLSLGGIPPLYGFFVKYDIFFLCLSLNYIGLSIFLAIQTVFALYAYLKIVSYMFFKVTNPDMLNFKPYYFKGRYNDIDDNVNSLYLKYRWFLVTCIIYIILFPMYFIDWIEPVIYDITLQLLVRSK